MINQNELLALTMIVASDYRSFFYDQIKSIKQSDKESYEKTKKWFEEQEKLFKDLFVVDIYNLNRKLAIIFFQLQQIIWLRTRMRRLEPSGLNLVFLAGEIDRFRLPTDIIVKRLSFLITKYGLIKELWDSIQKNLERMLVYDQNITMTSKEFKKDLPPRIKVGRSEIDSEKFYDMISDFITSEEFNQHRIIHRHIWNNFPFSKLLEAYSKSRTGNVLPFLRRMLFKDIRYYLEPIEEQKYKKEVFIGWCFLFASLLMNQEEFFAAQKSKDPDYYVDQSHYKEYLRTTARNTIRSCK